MIATSSGSVNRRISPAKGRLHHDEFMLDVVLELLTDLRRMDLQLRNNY